jgi:hypothetical protein
MSANLTPNKVDRKPITKADYDKMRSKDREMVRGKFIFHEVPGGMMSFVGRIYKGDDVERYDLVDGQVYELPLGIARHLNKNCWYPEYGYVKGEAGTQGGYNQMSPDGHIMKIARKVRRCSFQSLEFLDIDDLKPTPDIVTAQTVYSSGLPN